MRLEVITYHSEGKGELWNAIYFLAATKQLFWRSCLSVCLSVHLSVCHTFFTMFMSLYYQLSSNFQKLLALTKVMSMRKIKVRDQRSRSQRSKQILSQFGHFRTVTLVWIHIWLRNNAQSLKWYRKCALLYFKVICQISRLQGLKNRWFDPN